MSRRLQQAAVLGAGAAVLALYWWGQRTTARKAPSGGGKKGKRRSRPLTWAMQRRGVPAALKEAALRIMAVGSERTPHGSLWLRIVDAQELSDGNACARDESGQHRVWRALCGLGPHGKLDSRRGDVYGWHSRAAPPRPPDENDRDNGGSQLMVLNPETHPQAAEIDDRAVDQIDRDVGRTFPRHPFFAHAQGLGQISLRRVLVAWVSWEREFLCVVNGEENLEGLIRVDDNDDTNDGGRFIAPILTPTAYVQGMNMIVGHFLKHVDEARTFRLFCHIMVNPLYNFRHIVCPGMPGLFVHHHVLERFIDRYTPAVAHVLSRAKVSVVLFSTEWILTLFAYVLEGKFLDAFLDRFFAFGWPSFYQVALALLESRLQDMESALSRSGGGSVHHQDDIYASPNEGVLSIVKGIGRRQSYGTEQSATLDIGQLLERALHFRITNREIDLLAQEHESNCSKTALEQPHN